MACFETACVIAQVYLQDLEKVRRNVLRVLPGGLGGISRVLTAKMMGKWQVIIDNKEYENKLEGVRCLSISSCKTAIYLVSAHFL